MKFKRLALFLLVFVTAAQIVACKNTKEDLIIESEERVVEEDVVKEEEVEEENLVFPEYDSIDVAMPLCVSGERVGELTTNWIQHLGIWDHRNAKAVVENIGYSYTINFLASLDEVQSQVVLYVKPYLVDGEDCVIGSPCSVGWSGFPTEAQFFANDKEVYLEVGVQPEIAEIPKDGRLLLRIYDSYGTEYDAIYLSLSCLYNATEGNSLNTSGISSVQSISGAVFELDVIDVFKEWHDYDGEDTLFCDFSYQLGYRTLPHSVNVTTMLDSNDYSLMNSRVLCSLQTDFGDEKLYTNYPNVTRKMFENTDDEELYVTERYEQVPVGYRITNVQNRMITENELKKYVRVCFEFPEELAVRSVEEMESFNGRFLVLQREVIERELPTYYELEEE